MRVRQAERCAVSLLLVATEALADGGTRGALEVLGRGMFVFTLMLVVFGGTASVVVVRALLPSSGRTSRAWALFILPVVAMGSGVLLVRETRRALGCQSHNEPGFTLDCWTDLPLWASLLAFSVWAFVRIATTGRRRRLRDLAAIAEAPPDNHG